MCLPLVKRQGTTLPGGMTMRNRFEIGSLVAGLGAALLGCGGAPEIREFHAEPQLICPGDNVQVRYVTGGGFAGGRITAAPTPDEGAASQALGTSETPRTRTYEYGICQDTRFQLKVWNGEEAACGVNDTAECPARNVSVAVPPSGPHEEVQNVCGPVVTLPESHFSRRFGSLVVLSVESCTERTIEVTHADGTTETITTDTPVSDAFAGKPFVAEWTIRRNLNSDEGCPEERIVPSRTGPTPPPAICLQFTLGCPDTSLCPGS